MRLVKTKENKRLIELSYEMMLNAYAPYSNFSVGAAILSESGKVSFVNINLAYRMWSGMVEKL